MFQMKNTKNNTNYKYTFKHISSQLISYINQFQIMYTLQKHTRISPTKIIYHRSPELRIQRFKSQFCMFPVP